ncbi:MAG: Uma2 family endonuclease [Microscillaceae bacterium]|nr:Uma2 family endonuclease [Microscillaceae bacterium]
MEDALDNVVKELGYHNEYKIVKKTDKKMVFAHIVYHEIDLEGLDYEQFVTEDDTPVDNLFSEKQQRLYVEPLHANQWTERNFLAATNVGVYYHPQKPPIVPDMFLSMDVIIGKDWDDKKNRSYFVWLHKIPEVVVEIVSNKIGGENSQKFEVYAEIGVPYYIIHDPYHELYEDKLNIFQLKDHQYERVNWEESFFIQEINLGIRLWEGLFEGEKATWSRWCTKEGNVLYTGEENQQILTAKAQEAESKAQEAESKAQEAESKALKAEEEKQEALRQVEALKAKLIALGLSPLE